MAQKDYQKYCTLAAFMRVTRIKRSRAEKLFIYGEDPADEKEYSAMLDWQTRIARANNFVVTKPIATK